MQKIYSIEFDCNYFINPLNIDNIAREILEEYENKPNIRCISHINNKCIYTTTLKIPKKTSHHHYQNGININFIEVSN
jgi:hypothetical protein